MSDSSRPTVICLTPVKNEAWILERFLQCASTWADHIVLADQQSTDATPDIAGRFEKVTLIDNPHPGYDEQARQKLLIDAARRIPRKDPQGPRLLLALDADEILTANWMTSPEWDALRSAEPGTVVWFRWMNVAPNVSGGWLDESWKSFGFVDDGSPHAGSTIHSPRIPVPDEAPSLRMQEVLVLHYQYANWERMTSKQRWYQCWERLHHPEKRPVTIFRQYNFMHADVQQARPLREAWIAGYEDRGIDMRSIASEAPYHWDREVVEMLMTHGTNPFEKMAIWDVNWTEMGRRLGHDVNGELADPRSAFTKRVHAWLRRTQAHQHHPLVRLAQKTLQAAGW
jgi:hypothetical protein